MRNTWPSSSSFSPRLDQQSPLKYTPKSTLTFTHTLTPTWTGKYISINTFIFSVSLDAKYPRLTAPVSLRDNERWAEQQLLSDIHLALLYKRNSYHSWRSLGRVCTWTKRWPVIHTLCFYSQTFIFGAFFFTYQILTPLKSKNPCCALNTKRTRTFFLERVSLIAAIQAS